MPTVGPMELLVILVVALLVLGPRRLPDAGRSLGTAFREFKDSLSSDNDEPPAAHLPAPELPPVDVASAATPAAPLTRSGVPDHQSVQR
jgi:sec-independent protein translocase protein TatA